ncbi:MAG: class I SAM-dependent methyltransferase [Halobacteriota archaeon]|nr:class I SAM-dependent methyltransferase [Halobacteriota archaeon]
MPSELKWQYNEMKQIGTDYQDYKTVKVYDERMARLRDVKGEVEEIKESIGLKKEQTVLEIGCGTGEFVVEIAKCCRRVLAIDISPVMLEYARKKAASKQLRNISFINSGFLTYEHTDKPVDVVVSQIALHHLPDFWKMVALRRIHQMLKEEGKLYLRDVVFSFDIKRYEESINDWIESISETAGKKMAQETEMHIRDEYSTYGWVMEEMLSRSGFSVDKADYMGKFMAVYICTKKKVKV